MMVCVYLVLLLMLHVTVGFHWIHVNNPSDHPDDTIYHVSNDQQSLCRARIGACGLQSGRVWSDNTCRIPNFNAEHVFQYGQFEIGVADPIIENYRWGPPTNAVTIRNKGAPVDLLCNTYVCAHPSLGPGKLVIFSDNNIKCYVASGWNEHEFTTGYQVLMLEGAEIYQLTNVDYYMDELALIGDRPVHVATSSFINNDNKPQTIIKTLTYSKSVSGEWSNSEGFSRGTSMSVSAGIPLFADTEWSISQEMSFEYSYGGSYTESISVSLTAQVVVPGMHACDVSITARQLTMDVPYTATLTTYFADGSTKQMHLSGVYEGLSVSDDTVQIGKCLPI